MIFAVTGGTGCLGQPLVKKLIADGAYVKLLALPYDPFITELSNKVEIVPAALNSPEAIDLLTRDCDVVFHLAAKVHSLPKTPKEEQDFYQVNVAGTEGLLESARANKVRRFVFFSTVGVYGKDADFHGDEQSPCRPVSVYAKSKHAAEQSVLDAASHGGPEGVVLRFPVVYGPFDRGNVAGLVRAIYRKHFFYFGNGEALRSMISSRNAAEAAYRAAFEPRAANKVFCVTDGRDYTVQELVECICHALNVSWRPPHVPLTMAKGMGKVGDFLETVARNPLPINSDKVKKLSRPLTFSCEKAKEELRYQPMESLPDGMAKEVEWLRTVHGWK
jgi:nucleoside-diphosphate-sugar epimerase